MQQKSSQRSYHHSIESTITIAGMPEDNPPVNVNGIDKSNLGNKGDGSSDGPETVPATWPSDHVPRSITHMNGHIPLTHDGFESE